MNALLDAIHSDLTELYTNDVISGATRINQSLNKNVIAERQLPMYFTGNYNAKTVFVMLNPGAAALNDYSFSSLDKARYPDLNSLIEQHLEDCIHYGLKDRERLDSFDLKQAAFLFAFQNSGLQIPDFVSENTIESKLRAKENVLSQKLQLELIPYRSTEFVGILDTPYHALQNLDLFLPHVLRIFDAIIEYPRAYVIFGSKQFYHLFLAINKRHPGSIVFYPLQQTKLAYLKNPVSCMAVSIQHKRQNFNAIIPFTFPRRDLTNAFMKMIQYGSICYEEYIRRFKSDHFYEGI